MTRGLYTLVCAQFLSAFGDNAILFIVIAIVLKAPHFGTWYIPALQSAFLVAFVVLTPWVGSMADRYAKPRVLLIANLIKALGGLIIFFGIEPLIGYAVIGIGAATYSPAKYGIIPELTSTDKLVKANGWVEGATISAILFGTIGGAWLADLSVDYAVISVIIIYFISGMITYFIPAKRKGTTSETSGWSTLMFWIRDLLKISRARHVLLALSLFWACAATLRVVLVAWVPEVLDKHSATDIAQLTLFMAIGIIIGASLVPRLIPLDRIRRTRYSAYAMGTLFILLAFATNVQEAQAILLLIGITGGIFVVPLNAAIQQAGFDTVGSGSAVAVQNFFQNSAILASMAIYTFAAGHGVGPIITIVVLGAVVWMMTLLVSWRIIWRRPR